MANHCEVESLLTSGTLGGADYKVEGANMRDVLTGKGFKVRVRGCDERVLVKQS
jgi:hypothetical protein